MSESYRRTNDPRGQKVEGSTAGATGGGDLEELARLRWENAFLEGQLLIYKAVATAAFKKRTGEDVISAHF